MESLVKHSVFSLKRAKHSDPLVNLPASDTKPSLLGGSLVKLRLESKFEPSRAGEHGMMTAARRHADVSRSWLGAAAVSRKPAGAGSGHAIDRLVGPNGPRNRVPWWTATRCTNGPFVWTRSARF
jgi:hypothetical protein